MRIKPFAVEDWCNLYEYSSKYNLGETCVSSVSLDELFQLAGVDGDKVLKDFARKPLTYGDLEGNPVYRKEISGLYRTIKPEHVVTSHGAAGANQFVFSAIIDEPGTHVVTILPTYQQLYSIPEFLGADVDILRLKKENSFLPDLDELRRLVRKDTKLIVINNPHNPSGNLLPNSLLQNIVEIAKEVDAYLLCDETYRYLNHEDIYSESIADLYDKGISVSSMTKVFSLAGLRTGWVAARDSDLLEALITYREYFIVSGSMFDEYIAGIALEHKDALLARAKQLIYENNNILCNWVKTQPHLHMVTPNAATMAMIYYDYDVDSYAFCQALQDQESVFLMPGESFDLKERCFRIGYSCGKQELEEGLAAMSRFLERASYPLVKGVER